MSTRVGDKALAGEREYIMVRCFEITEDLTMEFEGESCNILNADGVVEELGPRDGIVRREVHAGYQCYVMHSWMKFQRTSHNQD